MTQRLFKSASANVDATSIASRFRRQSASLVRDLKLYECADGCKGDGVAIGLASLPWLTTLPT
jgi:hypothetical protein